MHSKRGKGNIESTNDRCLRLPTILVHSPKSTLPQHSFGRLASLVRNEWWFVLSPPQYLQLGIPIRSNIWNMKIIGARWTSPTKWIILQKTTTTIKKTTRIGCTVEPPLMSGHLIGGYLSISRNNFRSRWKIKLLFGATLFLRAIPTRILPLFWTLLSVSQALHRLSLA